MQLQNDRLTHCKDKRDLCNDLYIVGAGGFGREVLEWAMDVPEDERDWRVAGFLDPNSHMLDGFQVLRGIQGTDGDWKIKHSDRFICAIGEPVKKLSVCRRLAARGATFITLVHPTAVVAASARLGVGCILCPNTVVTANAKIGDFVTLNLAATIGHDSVIGDGCTVSPHASVSGWCEIGEAVAIGANAVVIPKIRVADKAQVGAGSVVVRHASPNATVFGVPASELISCGQKGRT